MVGRISLECPGPRAERDRSKDKEKFENRKEVCRYEAKKRNGDAHVVGLVVEENPHKDDYDNAAEFSFLQSGTLKTVPNSCILLDRGSTSNIFSNLDLIKKYAMKTDATPTSIATLVCSG